MDNNKLILVVILVLIGLGILYNSEKSNERVSANVLAPQGYDPNAIRTPCSTLQYVCTDLSDLCGYYEALCNANPYYCDSADTWCGLATTACNKCAQQCGLYYCAPSLPF